MNNLRNRYQQHRQQPVNYMNNNLLSNNPVFTANIHDPNFHREMIMRREQQRKRVRNINDLNLTKEQIVEYVICPIKAEKGDRMEIDRVYKDLDDTLTTKWLEQNWWRGRTNQPYKNIIKEEDYWKRNFKKQSDLIVHKVTDMDTVGLMDDYYQLLELIERHDKDLKVIFSASEKTKHKRKFKYVNKMKYRMKYNPKDYKDLTEYYKKQQKKYNKTVKQYDEVIQMMMDNEDITDEQLKQIEAEFLCDNDTKERKEARRKKENKNRKKRAKEKEKELEAELMALVEEHGEDILDVLDDDDFDFDDKSSKSSRKDKKSNNDSKNRDSKNRDSKSRDSKSRDSKNNDSKSRDSRVTKDDSSNDAKPKVTIKSRRASSRDESSEQSSENLKKNDIVKDIKAIDNDAKPKVKISVPNRRNRTDNVDQTSDNKSDVKSDTKSDTKSDNSSNRSNRVSDTVSNDRSESSKPRATVRIPTRRMAVVSGDDKSKTQVQDQAQTQAQAQAQTQTQTSKPSTVMPSNPVKSDNISRVMKSNDTDSETSGNSRPKVKIPERRKNK